MHLSRLVMLSLGTLALTACKSDEVTAPALPPLAQVRFINGVSDTGSVDMHMIDQVEFSPVANNLAFRAGTAYFPTEAKIRRVRVFPTSTNIGVTSQIMHEADITLTANSRVTLLLTGSARARTVRLWVIDDATQPAPAGQIGVRMVNGATGLVNGYVVNTASDPLPGTATFTNVGALAPTSYVNRTAGVAQLRVTDPGSTAVNASMDGPPAPATLPGEFPAAGVTSPGTMFSVYYFPAGAAGSANASVTSPSLIWFVDRNPCDNPPVAGCTP